MPLGLPNTVSRAPLRRRASASAEATASRSRGSAVARSRPAFIDRARLVSEIATRRCQRSRNLENVGRHACSSFRCGDRFNLTDCFVERGPDDLAENMFFIASEQALQGLMIADFKRGSFVETEMAGRTESFHDQQIAVARFELTQGVVFVSHLETIDGEFTSIHRQNRRGRSVWFRFSRDVPHQNASGEDLKVRQKRFLIR